MHFPKITIITPSFNQGQYLEQTIQSVLSQQYANLEYIIIDGGSTDQSVEIIKKHAKYLAYWVSEKDHGQSSAINKGLRKATGDIINWLNSDDYYEPNALSLIASAFENPDVNIVSGRSRIFKDDGQTMSYTKGVDIYPGNLAKTIGWARIDQPETFYRSGVIQKMGLLNENMHYVMDRNWWIQYLYHFGLAGVVQLPQVLVNFRLHENSKTVAHREKFQAEHDGLYYAMAVNMGFASYAQLIKNVCAIKESFTEKVYASRNRSLVEAILSYYLLLRANEFYAQNERWKAQQLLNNINLSCLAADDKKLWRKINFRNKYVPEYIIKLLRRS